MNIYETEQEIADVIRLSEIKNLVRDVPSKRLIRRMSSLCDTNHLPTTHPLRHVVGQMESHYRKYQDLKPNDIPELCKHLVITREINVASLAVALHPNNESLREEKLKRTIK